MEFQLYNTLTRQKETFSPLHGNRVDFYSCGPTVYNVVHVGNIRAFLFADTLFRWLAHGRNHEVRWVMNITDIDDKTIRGAGQEYPRIPPLEALQTFTRHYEEIFFNDLEQVNIKRASFFQNPRATESIPGMQALIRKIAEHGCAYEKDGSVYFSLEKYLQKEIYGKLLNLDLTALKTGTRTLADEIEKENVQDFVLWKAKKEEEPAWDFEFFGKNLPGRPGWHIECSAMAREAFGELPFDIHSGGVDLKFPHHEDEIAQSIAGYEAAPARFWVHNEHLFVDGQKMSKSLGNFYTLQDLIAKGHSPESIRFFLVMNHYQTKLNLTEGGIEAAAAALQKIRNALNSRKIDSEAGTENSEYMERFTIAMNDDLNTPQAVAVLYEALGADISKEALSHLFQFAENVFGVRFFPEETKIPPEIMTLANARQDAKNEKNFPEADRLRHEISVRGFVVRDIKEGYELLPNKL